MELSFTQTSSDLLVDRSPNINSFDKNFVYVDEIVWAPKSLVVDLKNSGFIVRSHIQLSTAVKYVQTYLNSVDFRVDTTLFANTYQSPLCESEKELVVETLSGFLMYHAANDQNEYLKNVLNIIKLMSLGADKGNNYDTFFNHMANFLREKVLNET